jgi:uracil-DNA glycosylase
MTFIERNFEEGWARVLNPFLMSQQFINIGSTLKKEAEQGHQITPLFDDTFRAFRECKYDNLKVVFLGLDPYPAKGVADGLAFSARGHWREDMPKSLSYIIDAIEKDVYDGFAIGHNEDYMNPDLTRWAKQGVLLLNTALSTYVGKTGVHLELWQPFIQYIFKALNTYNSGLIYILLGAKAKQWAAAVNKENNYVLTAMHPAACAYQGLKEWDCNNIFSQANTILEKNQGTKIIW